MSQPVALNTGSSASDSVETVADTHAHHRSVGSEIGILQVFANTLAAGRRSVRLPFAQTEQRHPQFRCGNRLRVPQRCPHLAKEKDERSKELDFTINHTVEERDDSCIVSASVTSFGSSSVSKTRPSGVARRRQRAMPCRRRLAFSRDERRTREPRDDVTSERRAVHGRADDDVTAVTVVAAWRIGCRR